MVVVPVFAFLPFWITETKYYPNSHVRIRNFSNGRRFSFGYKSVSFYPISTCECFLHGKNIEKVFFKMADGATYVFLRFSLCFRLFRTDFDERHHFGKRKQNAIEIHLWEFAIFKMAIDFDIAINRSVFIRVYERNETERNARNA
jgi:hypothetical protein